ncbi:MAG: hypothetical protein GWN58_24225 [Anaerolineae bacterium]|nr:hypothetical protein [Anaerolineae bacterium]
MSDSEFCYGLLIGFLVAGAFAYVLQQIRLARFRAGQASRREIPVPIDRSPEEITRASRRARRLQWAWTGVFVLLAIGAVILLISLF